MRVSRTEVAYPKFGKQQQNKYYEYGSQKYLKPAPPPPKKWDSVKTALTLGFGLSCLAVGVLTRNKI
jgi:hypothetical protein